MVDIPGVPGLISWLLGTDKLQDVRSQCNVSSIRVPREAHSEWLDVRLWGGRKSVAQASKALQKIFEDYYKQSRAVVNLATATRMTALEWQSLRTKWQEMDTAHVILHPRGWDQLEDPR